ncbi:Endonuclease/Exonuclease/phosphatase family protein [Nocardioides terrae]|uniref:Endonuclease/Exonuclease/phosphatase family protein n=1 Tax=Nocardioides terrae TaxID=574651 RepID=A0A1I1NI94_9ACTN|nr:peptidoglycan DD-metalloendopeptidase family protein [Nocardioides terrae]SFC97136.1 Endonuclease/Exonuclease/phosphatase family protein [Nocardioides terrae]
MKVVTLAVAPLVAVMALLLGVVVVIAPDKSAHDCGTTVDTVIVNAANTAVGDEQRANAATIIAVAKAQGVPPYGWVVGITAALQESGLRNLPHGDRDSLGLFQQRPSAGWGSPAQVMDPVYASTAFFTHLLRVTGWQEMSVAAAAQAVQRSAFPDAYASHEGQARGLIAELAPGIPATSAAAASACTMADGTVVAPLRPGTYTDLHNYGHTSSLWTSIHTGDDLAAPCGTPVLAATSGTIVIESGGGWSWSGRWLVKVEIQPGGLTTWYGHMRSLAVHDGQVIRAGEQIGEVGELGNATGCHLHFEVHPHDGGYLDDQVDAGAWLAAHAGHAGQADVLPAAAGSGSFRLASFNVLGSSHTGRSGDQHRGWPVGVQRIVGAISLLDARGVSVAGLQEFEGPQHDVFARRYAGRWDAWFAGGDSRNAVIWRADTWSLLASRSFSIPYITGTDEMPVVLLRNRTTGAQLYVVNVHNPSDMYAQLGGQRERALHIESRLIDQLSVTGTPIVFTGDFNDRDAPGCAFTPRLGSAFDSPRGHCGARPGEGIDHIFGAHVTFSQTRSDPSPHRRLISDHDLLTTTVSTTNG